MPQKLVVIGAGMVSGRVLEDVFEQAPGQFDVTLFSAEPRGNYNRIMLSPVLSGEKSYDEIITHDADWYARHGVECRFGKTVVRIDRDAKTVTTSAGDTPYDKLLIATGSAPFIIPVDGHDLPGVVAYRDMDNVTAMLGAAKQPGASAVVIGGGLLGLEAAAGLQSQGMTVTVLHLGCHLMERQLDPAAGALLKRELEGRGIKIHCEAHTKAILGEDKTEAVLLEDGTIYPANLVVMAVGIRPEVRIATDARLVVERGILVNNQMMTSDPDILSVGECVEHEGVVYGLVAPLYDMASVAAQTLMGHPAAYRGSVTSTKLKVTGVDLFSAGDFAKGDGREDIIFQDPGRSVYKRIVLRDNRIIGAVMYGDTADGAWFFGQMKNGEDISQNRDTLIFGPTYAGGASLDPMAAVAALPDKAKIRRCNGLNKSNIIAPLQANTSAQAPAIADMPEQGRLI